MTGRVRSCPHAFELRGKVYLKVANSPRAEMLAFLAVDVFELIVRRARRKEAEDRTRQHPHFRFQVRTEPLRETYRKAETETLNDTALSVHARS